MLGLTGSWLASAAVGIAAGYLLSPMIARFLPIKPLHAYQGMAHRPVHTAPRHYVPRAAGGGRGGANIVHPQVPVHYVPVRRSFDRSYDSWLHTTVNSLPTIG